MRTTLYFLYALSTLIAAVQAAVTWTAAPLNPPAVPLAVRSPYLSAWLQQGSGQALNDAWPSFWTGMTLGWAGLINVDETPYVFLGAPGGLQDGVLKAIQKNFIYTSTQSTFVLSAGPVDVTVNFLSPVEPSDLVKQSLPFSYLSVTVQSSDSNPHHVQVYTDISAEWVSGDLSLTANWSTSTVNGIITHQVQLEDQTIFGEVSDRTQYGSAFYSTDDVATSFQSGQDIVVRNQFVSSGTLLNTQDSNFRAISDDWPVFGLSRDFGNISSTGLSHAKMEPCSKIGAILAHEMNQGNTVVFTIGHVRDPLIEYITIDGIQNRTAYWKTKYKTVAAVIEDFLPSYPTALKDANTLDEKISTDASKISTDYEAIVELSVRQALGACEWTIGEDLNTSDTMGFLKEISSDGNVNTVDVIFPAWPIFLYLNPVLGKYLLEPLFKYQASGLYPNKWSIHDMGSNYPKALGHNDGSDEAMPVEESGNMLIMTLSYTQKSKDHSLITTYPDLLDQWTQYLVADSLIPANQLSTDDFAGTLPNQTNLAIKGTIGIKAMSVIEGLLGNHNTEANYSAIATSYAPQIEAFATAISPVNGLQHLELNYGNSSSWGLSYNLLGDKLLGTGVFGADVFEMQSTWYQTVALEYGVPLDTRHTYTKSDWQMFTAAIATCNVTRDLLITRLRAYLASGVNSVPLSDWYEATDAVVQGFQARPVVGGHLALLVV